MIRRIVGFHQDDEGDWVARLSCFHNQHVRHRPPFVERPWVQTAAGRAGAVGRDIECLLCDRAELPGGLRPSRSAGPFDAATVPVGLQKEHQVPDGSWGCLRILEGSARFTMQTEPPVDVTLEAGACQPIPPGVRHAVHVEGPVRLALDFLTPEQGSP